jgi:hypothetical protein
MLRSLKAAGLALALAMACSGVAVAQNGYGYYDRGRGDAYDQYGNRGYGYNDSGLRIARSTGYNDGSRMAFHDLNHYKRFNPYPRGSYSHADHGYHREYGDKNSYRDEYARGYRAGYASTFRR